MKETTLLIFATALAGCSGSLGTVPSLSELRSAVDEAEGWKILSTVNCEGRTECYNSAFGHTKVKSINCVEALPREANYDYEVLTKGLGNSWETRRSRFQIGTGPDGKTGWRLNSPIEN